MGSIYQIIRLSYLIRRLLQSSLSGVDATITFIDILLHITQIIVFEAILFFFCIAESFVFDFQCLVVYFGTWAEVLFRVGEEVVWTGADDEGSAGSAVGQRDLGGAGGGGAH